MTTSIKENAGKSSFNFILRDILKQVFKIGIVRFLKIAFLKKCQLYYVQLMLFQKQLIWNTSAEAQIFSFFRKRF